MIEQREHPRTHYIHRISYSTQERIVGAFVLLAFCILVGLLLSSGKSRSLFEDYFTIYGELQTVQAINKDTEVTISGLPAGMVSSVDITEDNRLVLTMKILRKYHNLLRADSRATLNSLNLAVVQKSAIDISMGSSDQPVLEDGSTIKVRETLNIKDLMSKVEPLFTALEDSIVRMNRILSEIDPEQLGNTLDNMEAITNDIQQISEHMNAGKGLVGEALYDASFRNSIRDATTNMEQASIKINLLLDDIRKQVDNVPELLEKIGPLLNEADRTIKATQSIWPLSTAVEKDENTETLVPPEPAND